MSTEQVPGVAGFAPMSTPTRRTSADAAPHGPGGAPRRGRPRSASTDAAILEAARSLLADEGWVGFSVEGVAARAGVAKTTVYRRFPSRSELAVAAVAELVAAACVPLDPDLPPRQLLRDSIRAVADVYRLPAARAAYLALFAEAQRDPELRAALDAQVLGPARETVVRGLEFGVSRGDVDPRVAAEQTDLLFDVLAGALQHRLLVRGTEADDHFVESLACAVEAGLGLPPEG